MNNSKTSAALFRLATAAFFVSVLGLSNSAGATENKGALPKEAKVVVARTSQRVVDSTARARKTELPRQWRWTKRVKRFDSMYRK